MRTAVAAFEPERPNRNTFTGWTVTPGSAHIVWTVPVDTAVATSSSACSAVTLTSLAAHN